MRNKLFFHGYPMSGKADLTEILAGHEKEILSKISAIPDIRELTDEFLTKLVKDSLVEPLRFKSNEKKRKNRTEHFHPSEMPWNRGLSNDRHWSGEKYPKTVVTICIPFEGDPKLFKYCPGKSGLSFPCGDVVGKNLEFDVIVWDKEEDAINEINKNIEHIERIISVVNKQVQEFNSSLPEKIQTVFQKKADKLIAEAAAFDNAGIPEIVEEKISDTPARKTIVVKKPKREPQIVIQYIVQQFVDQLNQINKNTGDVNNAIQSD